MNPLLELRQAGQSVWLDFITRRFITEGKLKALIDNDGLGGVTSNPTIFQKAMTGGPITTGNLSPSPNRTRVRRRSLLSWPSKTFKMPAMRFARCMTKPKAPTAMCRSR